MKKDNIILGVNSLIRGPHHDNGAFLLYGDKHIGISSERLDREKNSTGYKYKLSSKGQRVIYDYDRAKSCISYCLDYFGLSYKDVDLLVYLEGIDEYVEKQYPEIKRKICLNDHHLTHAYSSFFTSGFKKSAILVVDGQGKKVENKKDKMIVQSVFYGDMQNGIKTIKETSRNGDRRIGIGTMYDMVTSLIGFHSEGTTMGLSSYGKKENVLDFSLLKEYNGDIYANDKIIEGISGSKLKYLNKEELLEKLGLKENDLELDKIPYGYSSDISKQLQDETEESMIKLAKQAYDLTKADNLCIAGGVGLNSVANTRILKESGFKNVFIIPSTDDSGLALGAAMYGKYLLEGPETNININNFNFGKIYSEKETLDSINKYKDYITFEKQENICEVTSTYLNQGKIIGWFQGASESGPRALGNRSILADPSSIKVRDRVNEIKKREWWRPLAPAVLKEYANAYFDIVQDSLSYKYMLLVVNVIEKVRRQIPGVTHIDGTARVQIVEKEDNHLFYELIESFNKKKGVPILLNTSFNSAGEPIVETPEDAIKMFLSSDLDYLIIGKYIIKKEKIHEEFGFKRSFFLYDKMYEIWKKEIKAYEKFIKS